MRITKLTLTLLVLFLCANSYAQKNKNAHKQFELMDKNGDAVILLWEMKMYYSNKINEKGEQMNGEVCFLGFDANGDNEVSYEEVENGINWDLAMKKSEQKTQTSSYSQNYVRPETLREFSLMDYNKNLTVDADEMVKYYTTTAGYNSTTSEIKGWFNGYDVDKNGDVTADEFEKVKLWLEEQERLKAQQVVQTPQVVKQEAPVKINRKNIDLDEELSLEEYKKRFMNSRN